MKPGLRSIDSVPVAEDVVETIERVLEAANAGEVSSVAIATVERDGSFNNTWSYLHSSSAMLGSLEILKHRIIQKLDE